MVVVTVPDRPADLGIDTGETSGLSNIQTFFPSRVGECWSSAICRGGNHGLKKHSINVSHTQTQL